MDHSHNRKEYVARNTYVTVMVLTVTLKVNAVRNKRCACKDTIYDPMVYRSRVTQT